MNPGLHQSRQRSKGKTNGSQIVHLSKRRDPHGRQETAKIGAATENRRKDGRERQNHSDLGPTGRRTRWIIPPETNTWSDWPRSRLRLPVPSRFPPPSKTYESQEKCGVRSCCSGASQELFPFLRAPCFPRATVFVSLPKVELGETQMPPFDGYLLPRTPVFPAAVSAAQPRRILVQRLSDFVYPNSRYSAVSSAASVDSLHHGVCT